MTQKLFRSNLNSRQRIGLNWLIKACGNPSVFNYKDLSEATKLIFKDKLCSKLDYSSITQSGLLCFMEYFRWI